MQHPDPVQLRNVLSEYYNTSDLNSMCYDLGIDYDEWEGTAKSNKIVSMITYMKNRGRLGELVAYIQETRPFIQIKMSDAPTKTSNMLQQTSSTETPAPIYNIYGDYIGGDKAEGDKIEGDKVISYNSGDTFNMSGNFSGANVNVKSTLTNVNQMIGILPQANDAKKAELQRLIAQLNEVLQQAPPEKAEEADAVVQMTEALAETAASEKPNKMMMQITGDGLKKAAENLAGIVPNVVKIAGAIVAGILGLA